MYVLRHICMYVCLYVCPALVCMYISVNGVMSLVISLRVGEGLARGEGGECPLPPPPNAPLHTVKIAISESPEC